ncbi:MAG: cation diffusion facilitator family transporter [Acidimicrobiia bacterium]|nr:cation diffusion facilitator family transporter [Acidimicrobiia bacterium]
MSAKESRAVVVLALIANASIAVIKFVAAGISGSSAMLAEGFHSVADTGNQLFLLRGSSASRFLPSPRYAFGRGKEAYFWAYMVAVFLFVGGGVVAFMEGLDRVRNPHEAGGGLVFSLVVLGVAALLEIFVAFRPALKEFNRRRGGRKMWRTIRESKDPALLVVLFEDSVAVLGVMVAAGGLLLAHYTHEPRWDGIASIIIGVLLALTAWILAIETKSLLVGDSAGRDSRSRIRAAALSVPEVETVKRLLTMHLGPEEILVNMDLGLEEGLSGEQMEAVIDLVEARIRTDEPMATRIFIEPT